MPSTFFGLSIGKSGIYAANSGLNTTAHNISNAETEGYSRQVTEMKASNAIKVNNTYGMAGTGVDVTGIEQMRSEYYDVKFRKNNTLFGNYDTKDYYMASIENYFNEIELKGFTETLNNFFDSLQELSKNAADLSVRNQVTNYGQSFCEYFNFISQSLTSIQEDCNFQIKNEVDKINSIGKQIAALNKQINLLEVNGGTANDLRDVRNLLVDELSEIVNVSVSETPVGAGIGVNCFIVKIDGNTLVDMYTNHTLEVSPKDEKYNQSDSEGLYSITWDTGNRFDTKSPSLGGKLQALIEVRDGNNDEGFRGIASSDSEDTLIITDTNYNSVEKLTLPTSGVITIHGKEYLYKGFSVTQDEETGKFIYEFDIDTEKTPVKMEVNDYEATIGESIDYKGIPYYMSQFNEFVRTFSKEFNDVHVKGQDLNGELGLDFFNARHVVTGENYTYNPVRSADEEDDEENLNSIAFSTGTGRFAEDESNTTSYYFMTAANYRVHTDVYSDPYKIAAASNITQGVENVDNLNGLIALKSKKAMFMQGDPAEFLQSLVADVGVDAAGATNLAKNQQNIVESITNQRLSVSGVDTDEEAMNLIQYQSAYNLSSKVISVMNEVYNKLINEMGL